MADEPLAPPRDRAYWSSEIAMAVKRFRTFWEEGDTIIDTYRLQKASGSTVLSEDKYNILYSSTETIKPNLYAQRPNVKVPMRNRDRPNPAAKLACNLLESSLQYVIEEEDFDGTIENVVEDLLIPGLGQSWVRYEPTFEKKKDELGAEYDDLIDEDVCIEHVYWQDWVCGVSRGWKTVPWVARRCWMTKEEAAKRFGDRVGDTLKFQTHESSTREADNSTETAEVWEIWDKTSKYAYWFSNDAPELLDFKEDPLGLKDFFPCPRPLRAISNTRSFVPRALFTQYRSQAKQLDNLTRRIRLLTDALRVAGVYDGSQEKLSELLSPTAGNKMIKVDSWVAFAQQGGIKGSVEWMPITDVAATLIQLIQAREVCKNEIYEITGFSDIVRGVSKASETLGAQNIKQNWAGARLRKMQKEVQRFARDTIAIAGEIIAEHCSAATIALYGGVDIPPPEVIQSDENAQQVFESFKAAIQLLKTEKLRCAKIDIETDSTLLADQEQERKDRMDFLGAAGAFLQQAVPAFQTMPQMGPLLASMMMFTIRTFPASRDIEDEFEKVQKMMQTMPPQQQQEDNGAAQEKEKQQGAMQLAQLDQQTEQSRIEAENNQLSVKLQSAERIRELELQAEQVAEENRHTEAMERLAQEAHFKDRELALREREVAVKEQLGEAKAAETAHSMNMAEHEASLAEAQHEDATELEYDKMEHQTEQSEAAAEGGPSEAS